MEKLFDNLALQRLAISSQSRNGLRPSADSLSLGIGWDTMRPTGMNIGVGEGYGQKALKPTPIRGCMAYLRAKLGGLRAHLLEIHANLG